ncbi:hypothetical protein [Psychrilyobacter sp.]|uniref:hypothetical protein n=1 Tax=Psychrilyobacter sp. TaxID=2586924 RepID=UPI00301991E7
MKKIMSYILIFIFLFSVSFAQEKYVVHIKTDLSKDDAQICVAYNVILSALNKRYAVSAIIDASAVNTYKKKTFRNYDSIERYKIPERLRVELYNQFNLKKENVPETYGEFLDLLIEKGANFYVNSTMIVLAKVSENFNDNNSLSNPNFKIITVDDIVDIVKNSDHYIVY